MAAVTLDDCRSQLRVSFDDLLAALHNEHAHLRAKAEALEHQLSALRPDASMADKLPSFSMGSDLISPRSAGSAVAANTDGNQGEGELPDIPEDAHVPVEEAHIRRRVSSGIEEKPLTARGHQRSRPTLAAPRGVQLVNQVYTQSDQPLPPVLQGSPSGTSSGMNALLSKSMSTVRPTSIFHSSGSSSSRNGSRSRGGTGEVGGGRFAVEEQETDGMRHRSSVLEAMEELFRKGKKPREFMRNAIHSPYFEGVTGTVIMTSALLIGLETHHMATNSGKVNEFHSQLHVMTNVFFMLELALRLLADGPEFFWNKHWRWNWLDVLLTVCSAADLFISVLNAGVAGASRALRAIRLLRLIRTLRLVRALRSVREFHKMVYAVLSSMRTLLCSMLILFFVMYFFAIMFCMGATEYMYTTDNPPIQDLDYFFGSLPLTFYSLFLACSQGISWHLIFIPLAELHPAYGALFLTYIALILFGVMNVVTSVFVESAIMSAQHYKDLIIQEKQHEREIAVSHMKEVFRQIDTDGSGEIAADEMEYFLTEPGLRRYVEALDISADNTRMLFRLLDRDDSKKIDLEEFCAGCLRLQGEAKSIDVHTMIYQVRQFLSKWSEFTAYVEERFEDLSTAMGMEDGLGDGASTGTSMWGQGRHTNVRFTLHLEGGGTLADSDPSEAGENKDQEEQVTEFLDAPPAEQNGPS